MRVILASQSPFRKAQLQQLGLKFESISPLVDEEQLKESGPEDLFELTRYLAFHKAHSLIEKYPDAVVIGADQVADLNGQRLDKPGTPEKAIEQLKSLSGQTHRLITSISVISHEGMVSTETDISKITLRKCSEDLIRAYVKQDQTESCAGAYKIERAGLVLVEKIESEDPSAIQGLPLLKLIKILEKYGLEWPQNWSLQ